jgi:hypothetical protein
MHCYNAANGCEDGKSQQENQRHIFPAMIH